MGTPIRIEKAILSYPHLFKKHAPPGTQNARYSAELLIDGDRKDQLQEIHTAFQTAAIEAGKGERLKFLKSPLKRGSEVNAEAQAKGREPRPELEGRWLIRASDPNYSPVVVARDGRTPIGADRQDQVFSGCIVNAFVDFYWSNNQANPGVFVGLRGIQLVDNVNTVKVSGGRMGAEDMFENEEEEPNGTTGPMFDDNTGYSTPVGFDDI